ncbi:MAG: RnfABCDGE type electron transport complex subunit D [Leptolyngbyaceae cyanobacterium bins.59]|nr:RnfABCDGE type electron transport complex subunit D [Leptolyngbyaceae cyanobacterium bins.59]
MPMFKDARDFQILALFLFLTLGLGTRDWTLRPDLILVTIATCLLTQWLATQISAKFSAPPSDSPTFSPRSALITSLGLCLLLRADHWWTVTIAACLAILSKFVFRFKEKHCFNPANFGMIAALLLTGDAWVSPGQWGADWWYALLFFGIGGLILQRVGRWDTTAAFFGSYALLEAGRNFWLGWTWDVYLHKLMSGSLLLFALFMVTDPRSIPNARTGRFVWAVMIALLTFILRNYFYVSTAILWALFVLSPLTIALDILWPAPRFRWTATVTESEPESAPTPTPAFL